jgi:hypothetical protein
MWGTLSRDCSAKNWANKDGQMVCQTYKAFFAFVVLGFVGLLVLAGLDIQSRVQENRLGKYQLATPKPDKHDSIDERDNIPLDIARLGMGTHATSEDSIPYGVDYRRPGAQRSESQRRLRDDAEGMGYSDVPVPSQRPTMAGYRNDSQASGHSYQAYNPGLHAGYANNGRGYDPQR